MVERSDSYYSDDIDNYDIDEAESNMDKSTGESSMFQMGISNNNENDESSDDNENENQSNIDR